MTLPYNRNFTKGRQADQFLTEELHQTYSALKNINYRKNEHRGLEPQPAPLLDGALWFDKVDNMLKYYDLPTRTWKCVFSKKFQITDQITNIFVPANPVQGQLWIDNTGVLMYFDGSGWQTVKALTKSDNQWGNAAFENFQLVSPLTSINLIDQNEGATKNMLVDQGYFIAESNIPADSVWKTNTWYQLDNGELDVYVNGHRMEKYLRYREASVYGTPVDKTKSVTYSNKFIVNFSLEKGDIISYKINRNYSDDDGDIILDLENQENGANFKGWYRFYVVQDKWDKDFAIPNLGFEPFYQEDDTTDYNFLFVIPNLNTDKIFIGHDYDEPTDEIIPAKHEGEVDEIYKHRVSDITFRYRRSQVHEERVTGVHINPGRLTGIKKQIFLVDKENPVIEKSAYNTEFYGFRRGEFFGYFLLPSTSQDEGDYITSEDNIILNKHASENYDYIVSITYEFTWVNSNGVLEKHNMNEGASSYYIMNLKDPISVHVEGVKLEEAAYDINILDSTITIEENVDKLDVDIWSPYKKQYGYVRRTEPISGRAIIHLHEKISSPENVLVFLAGQLIHPIYGGITYDLGNRNIYVDNPNPEVDNMINMPWCVVDMAVDKCKKCGYVGVIESHDCPNCTKEMKEASSVVHADAEHSMAKFDGKSDGEIVFDEEGNANFVFDDVITVDEKTNDVYVRGEKLDTSNSDIYDYILAYGRFETTGEGAIYYDKTKVQPDDGIILFVEGLLVCPDDIIRDDEQGMIKVNGLADNMEYVLLRDPEGRLYKSSDIMKAYSVGVLSDSLVYFNGKLILNDNCFNTYNTEDYNTYNNAAHNEIKCYVVDEYNDIRAWKIFD